jgi:orotate phosphoribosyltransferase
VSSFTPCCLSFAKTSVTSGTRSPVFFDLTTKSSM